MNVPSNIFREYDIRGEAETDLSSQNVLAIARSYGTYLSRKGITKASVGGDVRISTERIRNDVIQGLIDTGIDVIDVGTVTSPLLYWSLFHHDIDGAIMITGSHNPKDMNGLKMALGKSTIYGEEIQKIREMVEKDDFEIADKPGDVSEEDLWPDYLEMLKSKIQLGPRKLKVVADAANGTASLRIVEFLESLGCEVIPLYCEPDGTFPNHHPDPQKRANMQDLIASVRENKADVGFGFDGDADRIGVVDDSGEIVWGDVLMALYWREILPKNPGATAIIEVKCSQALEDEVRRLGGVPHYYKAGHSLIKAEMKRIGALFAGEYSGHIFFADEYYGFDDSFYAAGRLLRMLSESDQSLSEMLSDIPVYYHTEEVRVECPDDKKFEVMGRITSKALEEHEAITVDGLRIVYPDGKGWGLIRASNTQPVLATRCEGKTPEDLEYIAKDVKKRMLDAGLPDFEWTY
ncbi:MULTISPECIES: phosphomannomutase/phosphoglucomutase [Dethiosulfovibrio]|jgi:phosphomannomutase/phosphoglucomutase|uniref:Phosphomannomutase/phosphoglucomutase n=2 Tax=Dethiosulfovibrio TaxID=47054 RepID=A0ABS9EJ47_9BACT|nr:MULTISPECIES: phosphomannomutase/phosphoglucomutase [Dethiosulfovibrio]MCF4112765.1 phosphomannomutase/phosphoglucomutase [Dethiosulfovibrio russensis]MCF4141229.1 phosphomannomutase/phosphoglucomutase [Dethiosulfovibrio marinus]MCF4144915.1 phosphomannomutase/phosphoglucomutase [Dethiosulfovibrio acidaminovorans]